LLSGVIAMPPRIIPAGIGAPGVLVAMPIGVTVSELLLTT
jgi:hypothetical protein